jgi:receptor protein-tyrosine kinase
MITPTMPRSPIAEEFRRIKRPLLRNIEGSTAAVVERPNLIMVTSALQGDGKTFTSINLAMSIAMEQDRTVLFVDADVAKASAGRLLGVPDARVGLIDVLENKGVALSEAIIPTNVPNLRILPAGNAHERSTELLASQGMQSMMAELSARYENRVIVFDSPPLLLTTEAGVLASFMGQVAFVVSTDETPQEAVTEALQHLGKDQVIGMVLNKAHKRRSRLLNLGYGSSYGYQNYGYGYGTRGRDRSGGDGV